MKHSNCVELFLSQIAVNGLKGMRLLFLNALVVVVSDTRDHLAPGTMAMRQE